jgi:dipeptidyl aminopeptidase/acylaminoacyl peptidase
MLYPKKVFLLACILAGVVGLSPLQAREKLDLERVVPVAKEVPIPTMDFFRPRLLDNPRLNLAGTHMAARVTMAEDRHDLLIYDIKEKTFKTISGARDLDIYAFRWLDDTRVIYFVSSEKIYSHALVAVDINRHRDSYSLIQYSGASLVGVPERNRIQPLVWLRSDMRTQQDRGVAEIRADMPGGTIGNLSNVRADMDTYDAIEANNEKHIVKTYPVVPGGVGGGYVTDREGELAFAFTGDKEGFITLHSYTEGVWKKSPIDLDAMDFISAGDHPGEAVVQAPRQAGKPRPLQRIDVASGTLGEVLLQDKRYDIEGSIYRDEITREIVGVNYDRAGPQTVWFDESFRKAQKMLEDSFPKQSVRIIDRDKTGRLLVMTTSDRQPAIYHWVNLATREAGLIKNSAPWIDPDRMRPMNVITYKTRDGHQLDAYVTMPAGASKSNPPPLVVLPHGGPWVRDTWGFDGQVQFLASKGYAVLQPNYRGSSGYDWMFPEEDRYEFRKMHDDVTDATKAFLASGYVDPQRVAIMGGSFGAYLALSGVAHEPLYRCAVTIAGVFDWDTVLGSTKYDRYRSNQYAYLKRKLGDPKEQSEKYEAISPVRHVDKVKVPVFVSHGKEDWIAEVKESRRLISELKKHRVPHEVFLVAGEGHGMSRLTNEVELQDRVAAFLATHLSPKNNGGAAASP